jgi:hypothetical protein
VSTVTIPAGNEGAAGAAHAPGLGRHVLEHLVQRVSHVNRPIGICTPHTMHVSPMRACAVGCVRACVRAWPGECAVW